MSQSIAVLIGNTTYTEFSALECCANDVYQMHSLLSATEKFSQIINLVDRSVDSVKDELRKLAESDGAFEEIFLYFSGHGLSNSDDFYMCFKDFREMSPNTTGLSRNDLLVLLRQFGAKLSVVVIDACEAGRNLIKNQTYPISRPLKTDFANFVLFSSCSESQFSLAGDQISLFTDEFIKACLNKQEGVVYYSDVEGALRDAFLTHPSQTPHFIHQGTSQEKFCNDATHLYDFRNKYLAVLNKDDSITLEQPSTILAKTKATIEAIEAQVPTKDEAQVFIDDVCAAILGRSQSVTPEINDFFEIRTVNYDDFQHVQNKRSVIELLKRRGGSDSFVESDVERKKRRQPFDAFGTAAMLAAITSSDEYDTTYNIWNRCDLKSVHVGIYFEPKFMALNRILFEMVFLPRLTECLILTCTSYEQRSGWGSFNESEITKKWNWSHHLWSDDATNVADNDVSNPYDFARNYVLSFSEDER